MSNGHIIYGASAYGYTVRHIVGTETVNEYSAGNSQRCSQTYLVPSDTTVPESQLLAWAKQSAEEQAKEWGVDPEKIEHCTDLDSELQEELEHRMSAE